MSEDNFTVLHADYHRNGVGGEGFFVGLILDHNLGRNMLVTWFPEYDDDGYELLKWQTRVSVIDPAEASRGNIYMHPDPDLPDSGGNAWRGDHYVDAAKAIRKKVNSRWGDLIS